MKKITFLFVLFWGCSDPEPISTVVGDWSIEWRIDTESRAGTLELNSDFTGFITTSEDPQSSLLTTAALVPIYWKLSDTELIFTRQDNNFELNYEILELRKDIILLQFAEDIIVTIVRK